MLMRLRNSIPSLRCHLGLGRFGITVVAALVVVVPTALASPIAPSGCVSVETGPLANPWGQGCARLGAVGGRVIWTDEEDASGFSNVFSSPDADAGTMLIGIVGSQRQADTSVGLSPKGDEVGVFSVYRGGAYAIEQYDFQAGQPSFNVLHLASAAPMLPANWGHLLAYSPRGVSSNSATGPRVCMLNGRGCLQLPAGPAPARRVPHARSGVVGLALYGNALALAWLTESTDSAHPYFETDMLYDSNVLGRGSTRYQLVARVATTRRGGQSVFSPSLTSSALYFLKGASACSVPSSSAQLERWTARTHKVSAMTIPRAASIARGSTNTYAQLCPALGSKTPTTIVALG